MSEMMDKGQEFSLSKVCPQASKLIIGIKWGKLPETKILNKKGRYRGYWGKIPMYCDSYAFLLANERICSQTDLIFYGNLKHSSNSVQHMGEYPIDGSDDNEQIVIDLDKIPAQYDKILFAVTISDAKEKGQHWGLVKNIPKSIRVIDFDAREELCCYKLSDDYDGQETILLGEIVYRDGEWIFCALGDGTEDDWLEHLIDYLSS